MGAEESPRVYLWRILAVVYVCQFSFALVFQSIPPVLRLIISDLGITHAQAGLLMSLFALPGIFIAIPGGIISDLYGMKRVAIASLLLMITGSLIVGFSWSFVVMALGRAVEGIGALTLAIVLPQILSSRFGRGELGLALGIFNTGVPVGTVTSFNLLGLMGLSWGWRAPIYLTTLVAAIALALLLLIFKESEHREPMKGSPFVFQEMGIPIWLVGLAWMWFNAAFISYLTFAQDFFIARGYAAAFASFMTSMVMLISALLSPVVGYLIGKFGREEVFIAVGGAALAPLFLLLSSNLPPFLLLALMGVFVSFVPPPIFSLPSRLVRRQNLGLAFGILSTCLNVGVSAGPYFVGFLKDFTGEYTVSFYLMSFFNILQIVTILILYFVKNRTKKNTNLRDH